MYDAFLQPLAYSYMCMCIYLDRVHLDHVAGMQQPGILQPAEADFTSIGRHRSTENGVYEYWPRYRKAPWRLCVQ
jgi:hypothetical protein